MKKFVIFLIIAVFIISMVSAQERSERQRVNPQPLQTIEGTLKLDKGHVAVQSGDSTYLIPTLTRYIGFINELREDVKVSIEGFLLRNIIYPVKVTIGGKSYDFIGANPSLGMMGFGMMGFDGMLNNALGQMRNNFFNRRVPIPSPREKADTARESLRQNRRNLQNRTEQG